MAAGPRALNAEAFRRYPLFIAAEGSNAPSPRSELKSASNPSEADFFVFL